MLEFESQSGAGLREHDGFWEDYRQARDTDIREGGGAARDIPDTSGAFAGRGYYQSGGYHSKSARDWNENVSGGYGGGWIGSGHGASGSTSETYGSASDMFNRHHRQDRRSGAGYPGARGDGPGAYGDVYHRRGGPDYEWQLLQQQDAMPTGLAEDQQYGGGYGDRGSGGGGHEQRNWPSSRQHVDTGRRYDGVYPNAGSVDRCNAGPGDRYAGSSRDRYAASSRDRYDGVYPRHDDCSLAPVSISLISRSSR